MHTNLRDFHGSRITVMGLGRFGGGIGVARWLASRNAQIHITDLEPAHKLAASVTQIQDLIDAGTVTLRLGGHDAADFADCDLVIANPAVPRPWENRYLTAARDAGVPVTTEIGLAVERLPDRGRAIGITGSAGKSTTSAMIAHILRELKEPVLLGGNIGGSLLSELDRADPAAWIVLELSSFMLHWLKGWSPHIAGITSIAANHLDWHGTMDHYVASKRQLLASQRAGDIAVFADGLEDWPANPGVRAIRLRADEGIEGLVIPGRHNHRNAAMAVEVALSALARSDEASDRLRPSTETAVRSFPGLPHRLQLVAQHRGIRFYNDSKSTTPEATQLAVASFAEEPGVGSQRIHLIAGGYDKGSDLSGIAGLASSLGGLYTIGATGPRLDQLSGNRTIPCGTLDAAMNTCWPRLKPGDIVLLSPGCASWDQFENYEARGRRFGELVGAMIAG